MHAAVETKAKIKGKPRSRQGTNPLKTKATLKAVLARLEIAKIPRIHKAKNAKKAKLNDKKSPR